MLSWKQEYDAVNIHNDESFYIILTNSTSSYCRLHGLWVVLNARHNNVVFDMMLHEFLKSRPHTQTSNVSLEKIQQHTYNY